MLLDTSMALFCPTCANILLVEDGPSGHRFYCQTCPYIFTITSKVPKRLNFTPKRPDDVVGDEKSWENAPREQGISFIAILFKQRNEER